MVGYFFNSLFSWLAAWGVLTWYLWPFWMMRMLKLVLKCIVRRIFFEKGWEFMILCRVDRAHEHAWSTLITYFVNYALFKHISIECADLLEIINKYFEEGSLYSLFRNVIPEIIVYFFREIGVFYKIWSVLK